MDDETEEIAGEGSIPDTREEYEAAEPDEDTIEAEVTPDEFVEPGFAPQFAVAEICADAGGGGTAWMK